ncbi:MAG: hypothetical protein MI725_14710 [Pirellulales bacterium]|nr:hypothetical protein [Pirellulales bacterium]
MSTQEEVNWEEVESAGRARPIGIVILSWLHLLGGMLLLGILVMPLFMETDIDIVNASKEIGFPPAFLVLGVVMLTALNLGAGAGMMLEKTWGWYFAVYYYIHSIYRSGYAFYMVSQLADQFEPGERSADYYYAKYGGRTVIHFLIFLYFFSEKVTDYFDIGKFNRAKVLGGLIMIYLGQIALTTLIAMIF